MHHSNQLKESFFNTLRDELLQIPDLPLISTSIIESRVQKNEKEVLFERLLSHNLNKDSHLFTQKNPEDEKLFEFTLKSLNDFDEKVKGNKKMDMSTLNNKTKYPKKKIIPEILYKTIMNTKVEDKSIKFRAFVAIFDIKSSEFPLYDVKIMQTICANYGFHILQHKILPFAKIKEMLYQKDCLLKSKKVSRADYEELFTNLQGLNLNEILADQKLIPRRTIRERNMSTVGSLARTAATTNANFMKSSPLRGLHRNTQEERSLESAFIVCILPKPDANYHEDFEKMLFEKSDLFEESLSFFYSSQHRQESLIDVQLFFPEMFQVNFMTLINIPSMSLGDKLETENKLEEMLDMNNFRVLRKLEAIVSKELLLESFQEIFTNHVNLAEFLLTDSKLKMRITAKLGSMYLNDFGLNTENHIKILDPKTNNNLFKHFFTEIYKFTRTVLIIRPFILKTPLGELFLNVFRINGFVIVKRVRIVLSEQQALYLAKHEKVEPESEAEYIHLMTDGESEIVLMSNFASNEKASVIVDGSNNEWTQADQLFNVSLNEDNPNPYGKDAQFIFKSMKDTISLGKVYDSSGSSFQAKIIDERRVLQEKTKLMKALLSSSFNFTGFSSRNQETTEELVSLFLPDCSKISNIYLILKPGKDKYETQITTLLERLGYQILEKKHHRFKEEETTQLLEILDRNGDQSAMNYDLEEEWDQEMIIFNVAKPAGKKEMLSLLRNFFLHSNFQQTVEITKENMYCYLVPCWNTASIDFIHAKLYQHTRIFDANVYLDLPNDQKKDILKYILQTTVGDRVKEKQNIDHFMELDQFDTNHINIKATSDHSGDYQIRIREFSDRSQVNTQAIKEEYECINLYYSHINRLLSQKCPSFYQYRIIPEDEEATPHHIFDCQEYMGEFFLKVISEEVQEHKQQKMDKSVIYNSDLFKSNRGPIAAFMYGSRLAVYVKKLEEIRAHNIPGCGQIRIVHDKAVGVWPQKSVMILEAQRYSDILSKISHIVPEIKFELLEALDDSLKMIFKSETYKYARSPDHLRIMPELLNPQSLRIFKKPDNRDLMQVHENYQTLPYDFEKSTYTQTKSFRHNKDFALVYVTPQITGKYKLFANLLYMIEYEFSQLQRIPEIVNGSIEDYETLLKGLINGLKTHHILDPMDEAFLETERKKGHDPIDFIRMELFFSILEAIDEKIERIIETKKLINHESEQLDQLIEEQISATNRSRDSDNDFEKKRVEKNQNIERFHRLEDTLMSHIYLLTNNLLKLDVCPTINEKLAFKGSKVKIPRERYFKPVFSLDIEHDLLQERYKKNVTKYYDVRNTKYGNAEFFQNADATQERWLRPPDLHVYDIKKHNERKLGDLYVDPIIIPGEEAEKEVIRGEIAKGIHFKTIKK